MRRSLVLFALLAAEVLAVSLSFDALPQGEINRPGSLFAYLAYAGPLAKFLTVAAVAILLVAGPRLPSYASAIAHTPGGPGRTLPLTAVHLVCALGFYVVTAFLFSVPAVLDDTSRPTFFALWLATGMLLVLTWSLALAPLRFWRDFITRERTTLLLAVLAGAAACTVAYQSQYLWSGLARATLILTHDVLGWWYDTVVVDFAAYRLGVGDFVVTIGEPCSGYEGIGLISVFTGLYLYIYRSEFRFPGALWLFPIGMAAIWLFNVLRIALLIGIGAEVSPRLALEGFHSQAGWIAFLIVSSAILYLAHRTGFARVVPEAAGGPLALRDSLPAATLLPLVVLLALGLVTGVLTEAIDWLYPLRAVAAALALAYVWRTLALPHPVTSLPAVAVGVVVAGLWLLLAAPDPARDAAMAADWEAQSAALAWSWLAVRLAGAVLLVPVVEELVFRGYLLARLGGRPLVLTGTMPVRWGAVVASSALFGILHDAWIAGFVAGVAYAVLRSRSRDIWAPITAHAVTNGVLAAYVLGTGTWSLW